MKCAAPTGVQKNNDSTYKLQKVEHMSCWDRLLAERSRMLLLILDPLCWSVQKDFCCRKWNLLQHKVKLPYERRDFSFIYLALRVLIYSHLQNKGAPLAPGRGSVGRNNSRLIKARTETKTWKADRSLHRLLAALAVSTAKACG